MQKELSFNKEQEIWKEVVGYEYRYVISNIGNLISLNHRNSNKTKPMFYSFDSNGYPYVGLYLNKKRKMFNVHRLVAIAFIHNPDNKPQVNHINGIKTDNRVENLEWCTQSENMTHSWKTGLSKTSEVQRNSIIKINSKKVINIKTGEIYDSVKILCESINIKYHNMTRYLLGTRKNETNFRYL